MSKFIDQAKQVLGGGKLPVDEMFRLAKGLKGEQKFDFARRLLERAAKDGTADPALRRKIAQQWASCTEKDPDLPLESRYVRAGKIIAPVLQEAEEYLRNPAEEPPEVRWKTIGMHQETFGIAGAIHKRWWQVDAQIRHLVEAQDLYAKGWRLAAALPGPGIPDQGYTAINAAFVLDLLAQQVPDDRELAIQRREEALEIRAQIRARLEPLPAERRDDWWTLVTLGEACLGLRSYEKAREWLRKARAIEPQPQRWEFETTAKQLARLAMLQDGAGMRAEDFVKSTAESVRVLREFVGGNEAALWTAFSGKVGLALSGGGFRASLFHIGVLARLAEVDMLRHVEVLSCVSGGSIIGALYYLKLRALLESKTDAAIVREDYIRLVDEMEREFTAAIEGNPRMQVFSRLTRLGLRTEDMGELLDLTLYGPVAGLPAGERPELRDLRIYPPATEAEVQAPREQRSPFVPKYDNWIRMNKAPVLIINATTLNTGHNWQFTAAFMGESPNPIVPEVDGNERLRRMYFSEAMPDEHRKLPLGRAVAASAGVPALFRPIQLRGLYPDRDVELVDGGVHDNQGVAGLREQDCTVLLISDACGQLVAEPHPDRCEFAVLMRSNDTLMARVRELEYKDLTIRKEAGLLRDFLFLHLKKELTVEPVDWIGCDLPKESGNTQGVRPDSRKATKYGVRGDVQNLLSGIRTDLDVFSEAEATALMASGYKMTAHYFPLSITSFRTVEAGVDADLRWRFLRVNHLLEKQNANQPDPIHVTDFLKLLKLGGRLLLKGAQLLPNARWLRCGTVALVVLTLIATAIIGFLVAVGLFRQEPMLLLVFGACLLATTGMVILLSRGGLYRISRCFDKIYVSKGSLRNLQPPKDQG